MSYSDRFIPRPLDYFSYANLSHPPVFSTENSMSAANRAYSQQIYEACTGSKAPPASILPYRSREIKPISFAESQKKLHKEPVPTPTIKRPPITQDATLDAPDVSDDFYQSVMDVSCSGALTISLFDTLYTRSNDSITEIPDPSSDAPHSLVHCIKKTNTVLAGYSDNIFSFLDLESGSTVTSAKTAREEEFMSADSSDSNTLFTGTKQGTLLQVDHRENLATTIGVHDDSIASVAYNPATGLIATGGNDDAIHIWDPRSPKQKVSSVLTHTACIRALQWFKNEPYTLISGGGTSDKKIVVTNVSENEPVTVASHATSSQITKILLGNKDDEILSAHGFSENCCQLWHYKNHSFSPIDTFCKADQRVLDAIKGPDDKVYTLVADETVRIFSNVFTPAAKPAAKRPLPLTIR